ncbi:hypothetical protein DRJ22_05940, partial [Candidatus Woesearchaeota archaeon]
SPRPQPGTQKEEIMRKAQLLALLCLLLFVMTTPLFPQQQAGDTSYEKGRISVLVRFGYGDKQPTDWSGEVTVKPGRIVKLEGWRFNPEDSIEGNKWEAHTHVFIPRFGLRKHGKGMEKPRLRIMENGVFVTMVGAADDSRILVKTAQGNFDFLLSDIPYGKPKVFLDGRARVERVPACSMVVSAPTEDDYPSAVVTKDGTICVAYIAFKHGEGFEKRTPIEKMRDDLSFLAKPTGGDTVMFTELKGAKWTEPMPLTKGGEDLFKTAIAVDGEGRVWVFWSRNVSGNWDIFYRFRSNGKWSEEGRLTDETGPDINPAAATDSSGKVWVAWQAFRNGNSDILAVRQEGERFGKAWTVGSTPDNEWDPAIAASGDGAVAVAWDTYVKGDYDVYCRTYRDGKWDEPIAIAASSRGEARASIAYDGENRLWIAYEESPELWGKDWGALEKHAVPLYKGRTVGVKILAGNKLYAPKEDLSVAIAGPWMKKKPKGFKPTLAAMPRLATDSTGRVWVGLRIRDRFFVAAVGTVWFEYLTTYAGETWLPPLLVPHTDNLLDNHPAILGTPDGNLFVIGSADLRHRQAMFRKQPKPKKIALKMEPPIWADTVNNEIYMADFNVALNPPGVVHLNPLPAEIPAPMTAETEAERADIARMRKYRAEIGGQSLRIWRGEFHRHTEISQDGGGDGALMDMWRYALDAARLDWIGCGDHDNGGGREYSWWITQKETDVFHLPGIFTPMFSYERSCGYPDGHRNVVFAKRGIRTLPRLIGGRGKVMDDNPEAPRPHSPDTIMLYKYLHFFDGICASHTSGTDMGTDWRDNDPVVEPVVEIYQGCRQSYEMPGAPRSNTKDFSLGGWRPLGFVSRALLMGYRLGFQASSDHISTHISYCNVYVEEPTREDILEAMKKRHVYGSTDNIIADVRCNGHFMG